MIAALAAGLELDEAVRRANAAAALSVTRAGPAASPTLSELDSFLASEDRRRGGSPLPAARRSESARLQSRGGLNHADESAVHPCRRRADGDAGTGPSPDGRVQGQDPDRRLLAELRGRTTPATLKMFTDMTGGDRRRTCSSPRRTAFCRCCARAAWARSTHASRTSSMCCPARSSRFLRRSTPPRSTTWKDLEPRFADDPSIRLDGKVYATPWVQGATSLAVNPGCFSHRANRAGRCSGEPSSQGKIGFFDDPTTAIMTAALYLGDDPQKPDLSSRRRCSTSRRT